MADLPYLHITNWGDHQHFKKRDPIWIRDYTRQLRNDDYTDLSFADRGVLHGTRLAYAAGSTATDLRALPNDPAKLTRRLGAKVRRQTLERLNHAGLLYFSDIKVISLCYQVETETETETETENFKDSPASIENALVVVLEAESETAFLILAAIDKPGYHEPKFTRARFAPVVAKHLIADLVGECEKLADWETYGGGAGKPKEPKDGISRFRNWLAKVPEIGVPLKAVPDQPEYPRYDPRIHPVYDGDPDNMVTPAEADERCRPQPIPINPDFVDPFAPREQSA